MPLQIIVNFAAAAAAVVVSDPEYTNLSSVLDCSIEYHSIIKQDKPQTYTVSTLYSRLFIT